MFRIKICGMTRREDVEESVLAGADALGFIFFPKSPRFVTPENVLNMSREVPTSVARVGVFVDASRETILQTIEMAGLTHIQLHGDESPKDCLQYPVAVIKAFRVRDSTSLKELPSYKGIGAFLLDAYHESSQGGTGRVFDWKHASDLERCGMPMILSGGLCAENVSQAMDTVKPDGVDVSSSVESAPGIKNHEAIRRFVTAAREAFNKSNHAR